MKYIYPAVFKLVENGEYAVSVPDLPGCFTCGKNLRDALDMAQDAISMWICDAEDNNENIPKSSEVHNVLYNQPDFVNLILVDTVEYRMSNDNRAVKKTLTIPNWLNKSAEKAGVNFSHILQESLKKHLGLLK